jgi:mannose-6-phosphate isomerase-like protein (cupin superfamily)
MNAQEYIENGVVLDYCLGMLTGDAKIEFEFALLLYPELRAEVDAVQLGLEGYAYTHQVTPAGSMKDKIWATLENINLERQMDLGNLPLINKFTDHKAWLNAVKSILPGNVQDERFMHLLTETDTVMQMLVMSATDIEDEVHEDVIESFIILDGECECHIGTDRVIRLKAGEYIEIPLHEHHDVRIISDYVVGVMQRIKVAA